MLRAETLKFLAQLKKHNSREWFKRNRPAYEQARADFIRLTDLLIAGLASFDPPLVENEPEDCIFRIYRDARFSHDKTPYKTNFGAFISDRGRRIARAGYYLQIEPGNCFVAGGLYMPPAKELKAVRRAIAEHTAEFRRIIRQKDFVRTYGKELPGDKLKTAPRDYPADHPAIDLLRLKSYEVYRSLDDEEVLKPRFIEKAVKLFRPMRDYIRFINRALDEMRLP
jgi:uncharacterized protein (TIGR02453 family)